MARRVDVGAVVGRVGVARALHAVVAGRAAVGSTRPPSSTRLAAAISFACALSMRSPLLDDRVGRAASSARTAAVSTCSVSASCGRNTAENGGPRRSRNTGRAGDSSSRMWTSVTIPTEPSTRPGAAAGPRSVRARSGSPGPRSSVPSPSGSTNVARSVEPSAALEAARRAVSAAAAAARGGEHGDRERTAAMSGARAHSSRSPATGGSETARRAVHAAAAIASPASPASTSSAWPVCGRAVRSA